MQTVTLNNISDFGISELACILDEEYVSQIQGKEKASLNPSDCLACSGCLTSSLEVIVNRQNNEAFREILKLPNTDKVLIFSPLPLVSAQGKDWLAFKKLYGFSFVTTEVGIGVQKHFLEQELKAILAEGHLIQGSNFCFRRPLLSSECPSFLLYAKKQLRNIGDLRILNLKSSQEITAAIVKKIRPGALCVSLAQCFDKKLERTSGSISKENVVDHSITSIELDEFLSLSGTDGFFDGNSLTIARVEPGTPVENQADVVGLNNGYAYFALLTVARAIFKEEEFLVKTKKFRTGLIEICAESRKGSVRTLRAEGVHNIVWAAQKTRKEQSPYIFIEMMACPKGCSNGNGLNLNGSGINYESFFSSVVNRSIFDMEPVLEKVLPFLKNEDIYNKSFQDRGSEEVTKNVFNW